MKLVRLNAILLVFCTAGCSSVPKRFRSPLVQYQPLHDRASVHGFQRTAFFQTEAASAALVAPQLGIYAAGGGAQGEYREVSDAYLARWFLEDTKCFRAIDEGGSSPIRIEGIATATHGYGPLGVVTALISGVSLTAFLGMPYANYARGEAVLRVYRKDEFLSSIVTKETLRYATTIYTEDGDEVRAVTLVRGMALRSAADEAAKRLCGGSTAEPSD